MCVFVRLMISPPRIKLVAPNLVRWFIGVLSRKSHILGNFAAPETSQRIGHAWHALTNRSKCQSHTVTKTATVARMLVMGAAATTVCCCCRRGSACRYDCLCFLVTSVMRGRRDECPGRHANRLNGLIACSP